MATTSVLDVSVLEELVGSDPEVVAQVLSVYVDSIDGTAGELRAAIERADASGVKRAAHRIKSPSLAVGALALGTLCAQLEDAAARGDARQMTTLFGAFDDCWRDVRQYVHLRTVRPEHDVVR